MSEVGTQSTNEAKTPLVSVRNLSRTFMDVQAVRGVSFDLYPGQVTGFIGANGAGKTTTMRMMSTLDLPDSGTISIKGLDTVRQTKDVKTLIGWMPDAYGAYEIMTVREYLDFFARAYGYRGSERESRVRDVMDFTELTPIADRFTDTLSKGMGQRLCLGRTLLHDPPLMILDEPAAGLDPKARIEFKHLVKLLADEGKTLLISSHILTELEDMCDSFLFIDQGQLIHDGDVDDLKQGGESKLSIDIRLRDGVPKFSEWVALQPGVRVLEKIENGVRVEFMFDSDNDSSHLLRRIVNEGFPVYDFHEYQRRLEEVFVDIIEKRNKKS